MWPNSPQIEMARREKVVRDSVDCFPIVVILRTPVVSPNAYSSCSALKSALVKGMPAGVGDSEVDQDRFGLKVVVAVEIGTPSLSPCPRGGRDPELLSP